jgi:hypothetical protein
MVEEAIGRAKDLGLPLEYRVADAGGLPFPDESFDAGRIDRAGVDRASVDGFGWSAPIQVDWRQVIQGHQA